LAEKGTIDRVDEVYRHSVSHLMASAIEKLYPDAQFAIGPPTQEGEKYGGVGFYYDLDMKHSLSPEDLPRIEKVMAESDALKKK